MVGLICFFIFSPWSIVSRVRTWASLFTWNRGKMSRLTKNVEGIFESSYFQAEVGNKANRRQGGEYGKNSLRPLVPTCSFQRLARFLIEHGHCALVGGLHSHANCQ